MRALIGFNPQGKRRFVCALSERMVSLGLVLAAPVAYAGMGGGAGAAAGAGSGSAPELRPERGREAARSCRRRLRRGGRRRSAGCGGTDHRPNSQAGRTTCPRRIALTAGIEGASPGPAGCGLGPELTE